MPYLLIAVAVFFAGYMTGAAVMAWRLRDLPAPPVLLPEDAMRHALVKAFRQAGKITIENRIELGNAVVLMESSADDAVAAGKRLN